MWLFSLLTLSVSLHRIITEFIHCDSSDDCDKALEFCDGVMSNCVRCDSHPCSRATMGENRENDRWCKEICPEYWENNINNKSQGMQVDSKDDHLMNAITTASRKAKTDTDVKNVSLTEHAKNPLNIALIVIAALLAFCAVALLVYFQKNIKQKIVSVFNCALPKPNEEMSKAAFPVDNDEEAQKICVSGSTMEPVNMINTPDSLLQGNTRPEHHVQDDE